MRQKIVMNDETGLRSLNDKDRNCPLLNAVDIFIRRHIWTADIPVTPTHTHCIITFVISAERVLLHQWFPTVFAM